MKYVTLIIAATVGFSSMAFSMDDEFGSRFTGQAPAGFSDMPSDSQDLSIEDIPPHLIEPAAGEYFDSEVQGIEEEANEEQSPVEEADNEEL